MALMVQRMIYYQEDFKVAKMKLISVINQLLDIDKPALPYNRDIVYTTFGGSSMQLNTIYTNPMGVITSTGNKNITQGFVGAGGSHNIENNFFIGYQANYTVYDDFERISLLHYSEDTAAKGISNNGRLQKTYNGYKDTLQRKAALGIAMQFTFLQPIGNGGGYALFTPLYFNISLRSSAGASISIVTKSSLTLGLNVQYDNIGTNALTPKESPAYNNFSFGFRVGCLLANLHY
jgi:hypothetical protein